jgi:hypothetical protein
MSALRVGWQHLLRVRVVSSAAKAGPSIARARVCRRTFSQGRSLAAVSTTPNSSLKDPGIEESQRQLELGTVALEAGNIGQAKVSFSADNNI